MRLSFGLAALAGLAHCWPSSKVTPRAESAVTYTDPDTGFTFSEFKAAYTLTSNIVFRFALPSNPPSGPYDVVIQVVIPNQVGWAGLAWGGNMVRNPLTVAYPNGQKSTVSSRWANGHTTPIAYTGAGYTLLTNGQKSNGSHWQFTAKCSGCTSWTGSSGSQRINPGATSQRLAFAWSPTRPSNPSSNTSSIAVHDTPNYWYHDFTKGVNPNFAELLVRNGIKSAEANHS